MSIFLDPPSPLVPYEEKKDKKYGLQIAKYLYNSVNGNSYISSMFFSGRTRYKENVEYAQGQNAIDKFKDRDDQGNIETQAWANLDYTMHKHMTRYVNNVVNRLIQEEYRPKAQAIDPWSQDKRRAALNLIKDIRKNPLWYNEFNQLTKQKTGEPLIPEELEEVIDIEDEDELIAQLDKKLRLNMNIEKAIKLCTDYNDYSTIKSRQAVDLVANGVHATLVELDPDAIIRIKYLDPARVLVPYSNDETFKDITMCGYWHEAITISDIKKIDPTLSDEELKRIWLQRRNDLRIATTQDADLNNINRIRDYNLGNVIQFWFLCDYEQNYAVVRDSNGGLKVRKTTPERGTSEAYQTKYTKDGKAYRTNGKRDIYKISNQVCMTGYWIVDSEIIIGYGPKTNMERAKRSLSRTSLPVKLQAPLMKDGRVTSMVEMGKTVADEIQALRLKAQSLLASMIPPGAAIDLDALEAVNLVPGKKMKEKEVLKLYYQKGVILYRSGGLANRGGSGLPINEIKNGLSSDFIQLLNAIQIKYAELKEIFSVPDIVSGGQVSPELGKKVSELSIEGAQTSILHLYRAQRRMYMEVCKSVANLYPDALALGGARAMYAEALGYDTVEFDKMNMYLSIQDFGINIEVLPSAQEWERFYAEIAPAVQKNMITMSDYILIKNIDNLKEAQFIFRRLEKKRAEEARAREQENIMANAQVQQQSLAAKGEIDMALQKEKQATFAMEMEKELKVIAAKGEEERKNMEYAVQIGFKQST